MKRVPLKISGPARPKVPSSIRVPDGISRSQYDSLQNLVTGLGTSKDKSTSTTYIFHELDKATLENAFRSDWIARKVVAIPAQDATREWRAWQSDNKDIEALELLERELRVQGKVRTAMTKARLYGGAAILLGVNDGPTMDQPLDAEKVGKDALKFLHVVSRWELTAGDMDWDISSPTYAQPKWYTRAGGDSLQRIHPTRVIRFLGNEVPDVTMTQGWGDSCLQAVNDAILAAGMTTAAGAQLLNEIKMDIIKIPDMTASMSNKQYAQRLTDRFGLANVTKSLYNILLLDKDEEWNRITANMTGIPDTLAMYLMIASGAADIPATRFLSQSPKGLNATGESDIRNHYDNIKSVQTNDVQPTLAVLDEVLIRSALGTYKPGDVVYEWNPLWQMDDAQQATVTKSKADAFKVDVDVGLIPAEVLRDARINQLIEDGTYPGLEQILDDYGPLEDIDEEEEVVPPGAVDPATGLPVEPAEPAPPAVVTLDPAKPANKKAIGDMAARIRKAKKKTYADARFNDATPRPLYVYRKVTNSKAIIAWAKKQGITELEDAAELHVTIMYCQTPLDWSKVGEAYFDHHQEKDGTMIVPPGGMRMVDKFDGNAMVLLFTSSALSSRHRQIRYSAENDIEWKYPDYQPHVTVAYPSTAFNPAAIEAYTGPIELGIEVWEEAKPFDPANRE